LCERQRTDELTRFPRLCFPSDHEQESKLVDQAERAEASAERAEKKAENMLKASGVRFRTGFASVRSSLR
jgi:hypothetical protein